MDPLSGISGGVLDRAVHRLCRGALRRLCDRSRAWSNLSWAWLAALVAGTVASVGGALLFRTQHLGIYAGGVAWGLTMVMAFRRLAVRLSEVRDNLEEGRPTLSDRSTVVLLVRVRTWMPLLVVTSFLEPLAVAVWASLSYGLVLLALHWATAFMPPRGRARLALPLRLAPVRG